MKIFSFITITFIFLIISCGPQNVTDKFDASGYISSKIDGSDITELILNDEKGVLIEKGYELNGQKTGQWTTYWQDGVRVKSIKNYIKGRLNGSYFKFNDRNQILEHSHYLNDEYHGYHVIYSWARPIKEINYSYGKIDGEMKVYFDKNGQLQKTISFVNGVQNGPFKQFDYEGNLVLEYMYKNGEKVSGGPVVDDSKKK